MKAEFRLTTVLLKRFSIMFSVFAIAIFALSMKATAQDMSHNHMAGNYDPTAESEIIQDWAKQKLAKSPRHKDKIRRRRRSFR